MLKNIFIFRHGETKWNNLGIVQGRTDIPLSELGVKQAEAIHEHLLGKGIDKIYSSPLKRALKTAEIVAEKLNAEVIIENNLKEVDYGLANSEKKEDLERLFGMHIRSQWSSSNPIYDNIEFPQGESKIDARNRIVQTVGNIASKVSNENVCFSSHGFVIKQLVIATKHPDHKGLKNCELVHFQFDPNLYISSKNKYDSFRFVRRIDTQPN